MHGTGESISGIQECQEFCGGQRESLVHLIMLCMADVEIHKSNRGLGLNNLRAAHDCIVCKDRILVIECYIEDNS